MDRSKISQIKNQSLAVTLLLALFWPVALWGQSAPAASPAPAKSEPKANEINPFAELDEEFASPPRADEIEPAPTPKPKKKEGPLLLTGFFYGHLWYVSEDPKRLGIAVTPIDEALPRHDFVVDPATEIVVDGNTSKFEDLHVGQKVAVRYFSQERLAIAEAIFVEHGDFKPENYGRNKRRGKKKKPKPK